MQDPDVLPPELEGETGGGVDAVRPTTAVSLAATVNNIVAFTPPPWITATALP
jgi:hypothetical protein